MRKTPMRKVLIDVGDGPDGFTIYQNEEKAIVLHSSPDSLFIDVSTMGASGSFGPMLPDVARQLKKLLRSK